MDDDIEELIPKIEMTRSKFKTSVQIKKTSKQDDGFTRVEKSVEINKQICVVGPLIPSEPSTSAFSNLPRKTTHYADHLITTIMVKDLLIAEKEENRLWKIRGKYFFRTCEIYGRVVVLSHHSKNDSDNYKITIDDGTGIIIGLLSISKDIQKNCENNENLMKTNMRNIEENMWGNLSEEQRKELLKNCRIFQNVIARQNKQTLITLPLGVYSEKCLIVGHLLQRDNDEVPILRVTGVKHGDWMEILWKYKLIDWYKRYHHKTKILR